jgi:hypothetical protein
VNESSDDYELVRMIPFKFCKQGERGEPQFTTGKIVMHYVEKIHRFHSNECVATSVRMNGGRDRKEYSQNQHQYQCIRYCAISNLLDPLQPIVDRE